MRNEQEYNDRNFRDRERNRAWHRDRYNRHPEHDQNSANRWGEPDPYMRTTDWEQRRHEERRDHSGNFNRDDWRPFEQRDNRHFQEEDRYRNNYRNEHPDWQHHEQHFAPRNQHASDRWSSGREFPEERHHHPRHASERFYREQRRRHY